MAPLRGGDGEAEKIPFRWLDAARYAAASVVTVLIIIVIVKATRVVLVPGSLYVSVDQGSILFTPLLNQTLLFHLKLRIYNQRRDARMYYVNVTAYLFDYNTPASSSDPEYDSVCYFPQPDLAMQQQWVVDYNMTLSLTNISMPEFFDRLYGNYSARMSGVTMRLDATLFTEEIRSATNTSSRPITYYCWPLAVLGNPGVAVDWRRSQSCGTRGDDVFCRDAQGSRFI